MRIWVRDLLPMAAPQHGSYRRGCRLVGAAPSPQPELTLKRVWTHAWTLLRRLDHPDDEVEQPSYRFASCLPRPVPSGGEKSGRKRKESHDE